MWNHRSATGSIHKNLKIHLQVIRFNSCRWSLSAQFPSPLCTDRLLLLLFLPPPPRLLFRSNRPERESAGPRASPPPNTKLTHMKYIFFFLQNKRKITLGFLWALLRSRVLCLMRFLSLIPVGIVCPLRGAITSSRGNVEKGGERERKGSYGICVDFQESWPYEISGNRAYFFTIIFHFCGRQQIPLVAPNASFFLCFIYRHGIPRGDNKDGIVFLRNEKLMKNEDNKSFSSSSCT